MKKVRNRAVDLSFTLKRFPNRHKATLWEEREEKVEEKNFLWFSYFLRGSHVLWSANNLNFSMQGRKRPWVTIILWKVNKQFDKPWINNVINYCFKETPTWDSTRETMDAKRDRCIGLETVSSFLFQLVTLFQHWHCQIFHTTQTSAKARQGISNLNCCSSLRPCTA